MIPKIILKICRTNLEPVEMGYKAYRGYSMTINPPWGSQTLFDWIFFLKFNIGSIEEMSNYTFS